MTCQWSRGLDAGEVLPPALGDEESEAHGGHVTCARRVPRAGSNRCTRTSGRRACVRCARPVRMRHVLQTWTVRAGPGRGGAAAGARRAAHGTGRVRAARARGRAALRGAARARSPVRGWSSWRARATTAATPCTRARCWPGAGSRCTPCWPATRVHEGGLAALLRGRGRALRRRRARRRRRRARGRRRPRARRAARHRLGRVGPARCARRALVDGAPGPGPSVRRRGRRAVGHRGRRRRRGRDRAATPT